MWNNLNPYEVLGVPENADQETIKKAYKELVKKYHPDIYPGDKSYAEKRTKEINKKISVNITFKADLMRKEQGKPKYGGDGKGGCLLAISDVSGQDVCSIRIRQGLLTVITFRDNNDPEKKWTPMVGDGFIVLDISKYNNKFVNVNVVAERAGVENVHPHRFRRTFATGLASRGMKIQDVKVLLGHTNINTTMRYVCLDEEKTHISYRQYII